MIINLAIAAGASFVTIFVASIIAVMVSNNSFIKMAIQLLAMGALGYGLYTIGFIGIIPAIAIAAVPITTRVVSYIFIKILTRRAISGKMGKESRWAAELHRERDTEFMQAAQVLPRAHLTEVSILADSKEELRELTIERAEEYQ